MSCEEQLKGESRHKEKDASVGDYRFFVDGYFNTRFPAKFNVLTGLSDGGADSKKPKHVRQANFRRINNEISAQVQ